MDSRKDWSPTEYTWICSEHFVSGTKCNNPLAPNYVPTLFKHVKSPIKRKLKGRVQVDFERRQSAKQRRLEEAEKEKLQKEAATQQQLREQEAKRRGRYIIILGCLLVQFCKQYLILLLKTYQ